MQFYECCDMCPTSSQIIFLERTDNDELMYACQQAVLVAKLNLLSYVEIPLTASSNVSAIAAQVNGTANVDVIIGCVTSDQAAVIYKVLADSC